MVSKSKVPMSLLHQFLYDIKSDEDLHRLLEQNPELEEFHLVVNPMHEALFMGLSGLSQQNSDPEGIEEIREDPTGISVVVTRDMSGTRVANVFEVPATVLTNIALQASSAQAAMDAFVVLQIALHHPEFLTEQSYWMLQVIVEEEGKRGNANRPFLERIRQALELCLENRLVQMPHVEPTDTLSEKTPWYKVWFKVYFSPHTETYKSLMQADGVSLSRAKIWIADSTTIGVLFPLVLYWLSGGRIIHDDLANALRTAGGIGWVLWIMSGFLGIVFSIIIFQVGVHTVNWLAQRLGGINNTEQMGFLMGAIGAPASIVDTLIEGLLSPTLGLVLRGILLLIEIILVVILLRAAHQLSWWRAIAVVGIIGIVLVAVMGVWFALR